MPELKLPKAWDSWRAIHSKDPKRVVKLIEQAQKLDAKRREVDATSDALKREVEEIKAVLMADFKKADLTEVKTKLGTARFVTKDIPVVDPDAGGWESIYTYIIEEALTEFIASLNGDWGAGLKAGKGAKYIAQHGKWELIQKRLGEKACQERWEAGEKIPGAKPFTKGDIKLSE